MSSRRDFLKQIIVIGVAAPALLVEENKSFLIGTNGVDEVIKYGYSSLEPTIALQEKQNRMMSAWVDSMFEANKHYLWNYNRV